MNFFLRMQTNALSTNDRVNFSLINLKNAGKKDTNGLVIYKTDDPKYNQLLLTIVNKTNGNRVLYKDMPIIIQPNLSADSAKKIQINESKIDGQKINLVCDIVTDYEKIKLHVYSDKTDFALLPTQKLEIQLTNIKPTDNDNSNILSINLSEKDSYGLYRYSKSFPYAIISPPCDKQLSLLDTAIIQFTKESYRSGDTTPYYTGGHDGDASVIYVSGDSSVCTENLNDNTLIIGLQNSNINTPLKKENEGKPINQAKFIISVPLFDSANFSSDSAYSNNQEYFCTKNEVSYIMSDIGQQPAENKWTSSYDEQGSAIKWVFTPQTEQNGNKNLLDAGEAVHFVLSNIVSNLPAGQTILYISWHNIGSYNDGITALSVNKQKAKPTIKAFSITKKLYTAYIDPYTDSNKKQGVYIKYSVYGASQWSLRIEQSENADSNSNFVLSKNIPCSLNGTIPIDPNYMPGQYNASLTSIDN
jgi:hypothetical protein